MARALATALVMSAALSCLQRPAIAQVISPGALSAAHRELEGVKQCTHCHELRQRGISGGRCLECHSVLKSRIEKRFGYHARVARQDCADCHKEHLGARFDLIRLDTARFAHERTGYILEGAHARLSCRACHQPRFVKAADVTDYHDGTYLPHTFLGLSTECVACHQEDSPHGRQFGARKCESCHESTEWTRTPGFNHDDTRYALTGKHREVDCGGCHPAATGKRVQFRGLQFGDCSACHRDPHAGRLGGACSRCHSTLGWRQLDASAVARTFDHAKTRFPLRGAHSRAACARCHEAARSSRLRIRFTAGTSGRTFAMPAAENCASCHVDPHPQRFAEVGRRQSCAACHNEVTWVPATYDVGRHNRAGRFTLDGAHAVTPCGACHTAAGGVAFAMPQRVCGACHAKADPHKGQFGRADCGECHGTAGFRPARFDHKYAAGRECASCHADRDPHGGQFAGRGCDACHNTQTFRISGFDHVRTSFPLDGAHAGVSCSACHKRVSDSAGRPVIRYRPLSTSCASCHGGAT